MVSEDKTLQRFEAGRIFNPAAPIDEKALFAGRREQIGTVIEVISQRGQHSIIFGERGVGKTSMANVLHEFLEGVGKEVYAPRENCVTTDTFSSLWKKVFGKIQVSIKTRKMGFNQKEEKEAISVIDMLPIEITPDDVCRTLEFLGRWDFILIIIIDEFDRLEIKETRVLCADTIKALSDHSIPVTLILIGVADSVTQLIEEHQSVERALVQIRMPRMPKRELEEIILKGLERLTMTIEDEALNKISLLSTGLPYYTHLLGLHATYEAIDSGEKHITVSMVEKAILKALDQAQETIRKLYHKATTSQHKDNLYSDVLLACALAKTDDRNSFAAGDIREPMYIIKNKKYEIPSFSRHLHDFCEETRGPILQKIGAKHRQRFRFINPLLQPFIKMRGFADGKIKIRD